MPLHDHTVLNDHRPFVLTGFVAFPSFMAAMIFMLARFVPLVFFMPLADIVPLVVFVPVAGLMSPFVFPMMIVIMIVLGKRWNSYADCKSKSRCKAVSNQFHLVHLRC